MIAVNLLPNKIKEALEREKKYALISKAAISIFTIMTLLTIPLLLGRIILKNRFITTVATSTQVTLQPRAGSYDIATINKKIKSIAKIQEEFIPWSKLFIVLSKKVPAGISLSKIDVNQDTKTLTVSGYSETRADFLAFKNSLENDPLFTNIESPVSNILKQTAIDFTLQITLDTTNL